MVRALDTDHRLTFEEYLEFEETSNVRHEIVDLAVPVAALYENVDMSPVVSSPDEPDIR